MKRCASFTIEQWIDFNWKQAAKLVFSLQRRIAEAVKQNRYNKVKVLQRLLVNSKSAKALAVKQVKNLLLLLHYNFITKKKKI